MNGEPALEGVGSSGRPWAGKGDTRRCPCDEKGWLQLAQAGRELCPWEDGRDTLLSCWKPINESTSNCPGARGAQPGGMGGDAPRPHHSSRVVPNQLKQSFPSASVSPPCRARPLALPQQDQE